MRKLFLTIAAVCMALAATAQTAKADFKSNIRLSASNYLAYPGPAHKELTPLPDSLHPFYISHYGRHGSRFLIGRGDYDEPYEMLGKAADDGKLTAFGLDVLRRVELLRREAEGRLGELTPLGAEQHRGIARRMYGRFPEVFAGDADVDAKSTVVIRCILSMENELLELTRLNPKLDIRHDASQHDMYYMNLDDPTLKKQKMPAAAKKAFEDFYAATVSTGKVMARIFNDTAYANRNIDTRRLNDKLFKLAANVQSCESRHKVTLYDVFDDDEIYANWQASNAWWYINYGACKLNGATQPFSQGNLLRKIIAEADSCIALGRPGATLRFGHEVVVLPLVCLLGIDGYDLQTDNLKSLERKGWINYRVFPMGANVQLVFYRTGPADKDVLVRVLLNENEARLPIKTDRAPLYHWSDIREYCLKKLSSYSTTTLP